MKWVKRRQQQQALKLPLPTPSPVHEFLPPIEPSSPGIESLSDLEKVAVLGHGNGGTVYKVRHRCTSAIFALKVICSRQEEKLNVREARIFQKCSDSPFIVQCLGVLCANGENGDISLVMEYMDGGSLLDLLTVHRRLGEEHIAHVAKQVLQGLNYLHGIQIAHRDIKPSNLLINSHGEVKIADFGSSREVGEAIEACCYSYVGTCAYMSPERFNPDKCGYNGFAADVWALGLALLECHVGYFPLISKGQRPDWATLMCAICYGDLPHMPEASLQFQSFIRQCLEKDWRKRATVKELLNHPFVADAVSK